MLSKSATNLGNGVVGLAADVTEVCPKVSGVFAEPTKAYNMLDGNPFNGTFNLSSLERCDDICNVATKYGVDTGTVPDGDPDCRPSPDEKG